MQKTHGTLLTVHADLGSLLPSERFPKDLMLGLLKIVCFSVSCVFARLARPVYNLYCLSVNVLGARLFDFRTN